MIYEFIKEKLNTLEPITGKIFPVSANLDEVEGALAVYSFQSTTPTRDMCGEIHHYTDVVYVDLLGPMYDQLAQLYFDAQDILDVSNLDTGYGEFIFSLETSVPERDVFDPDVGLYRKSLKIDVNWCRL